MKYLLLTFVLTFSTLVFAQKVFIFENKAQNIEVEVEESDLLKLEYKGYLGQLSLYQSKVVDFNDSTIVFESINAESQAEKHFTVKTTDIVGFRKISKFGQLLKPLVNLGVTIGSYFIFDSSDKFNDTEKIVYSAGAGIAVNFLMEYLFKENIEFRIADGWEMRVKS